MKRGSPSPTFPETPERPGRIEGNPLIQVWFGVKFNVTATEELSSQTSRPSHPAIQSGGAPGPPPSLHAPHPTLAPEERLNLQCPPPDQLGMLAEGGPESHSALKAE